MLSRQKSSDLSQISGQSQIYSRLPWVHLGTGSLRACPCPERGYIALVFLRMVLRHQETTNGLQADLW